MILLADYMWTTTMPVTNKLRRWEAAHGYHPHIIYV
jgi:hypothetical protein